MESKRLIQVPLQLLAGSLLLSPEARTATGLSGGPPSRALAGALSEAGVIPSRHLVHVRAHRPLTRVLARIHACAAHDTGAHT